jgi:hypothetical protein
MVVTVIERAGAGEKIDVAISAGVEHLGANGASKYDGECPAVVADTRLKATRKNFPHRLVTFSLTRTGLPHEHGVRFLQAAANNRDQQ